MKTCVVIYNPNSGHTLKKKNIPLYKKVIEDFGYTVTFIGTKYKGHARDLGLPRSCIWTRWDRRLS